MSQGMTADLLPTCYPPATSAKRSPSPQERHTARSCAHRGSFRRGTKKLPLRAHFPARLAHVCSPGHGRGIERFSRGVRKGGAGRCAPPSLFRLRRRGRIFGVEGPRLRAGRGALRALPARARGRHRVHRPRQRPASGHELYPPHGARHAAKPPRDRPLCEALGYDSLSDPRTPGDRSGPGLTRSATKYADLAGLQRSRDPLGAARGEPARIRSFPAHRGRRQPLSGPGVLHAAA